MAGSGHKRYSLRTIWGIAKSPELCLTNEEVHLVVYANTGKESMRDLTQREINHVVMYLSQMKSSASGEAKNSKGNSNTISQREKISKLQEALGWNEARVNGMCKRMFRIDKLEWLNPSQCSKLIEALKGMLQRQKLQEAGEDVAQPLLQPAT